MEKTHPLYDSVLLYQNERDPLTIPKLPISAWLNNKHSVDNKHDTYYCQYTMDMKQGTINIQRTVSIIHKGIVRCHNVILLSTLNKKCIFFSMENFSSDYHKKRKIKSRIQRCYFCMFYFKILLAFILQK